MRYESEPNQFVVRVYEDDAGDNYCATAQIRKYGDRGWMSSISSPRLFDALPEHFNTLLDSVGVVTLEGYMSKAMSRAVRMKARGWATFNITHTGTCAGREMPWVVLSKLQE